MIDRMESVDPRLGNYLSISLLHAGAGPGAIEPVPSLMAFRSPPPDARLPGRGLPRFRVGTGCNIGEEVVVGEVMLTLQQTLQVRSEFPRTEGGTFLNADPVLEKKLQVGAYNITNRGGALLNAIESIDSKSLGLIKPHVP
jgi:hypothetical protein